MAEIKTEVVVFLLGSLLILGMLSLSKSFVLIGYSIFLVASFIVFIFKSGIKEKLFTPEKIIIIVVALGLIGFLFTQFEGFKQALFQTNTVKISKFENCVLDTEIPCSNVIDCRDYLSKRGAPPSFLQQTKFACVNNLCEIEGDFCIEKSETG